MNDDGVGVKSVLANPLPIVMVVLLTAGVLVKTVPLKSARPTESERAKSAPVARQDVEARLWQDPFPAVDKARQAASDTLAFGDRARALDAQMAEEFKRIEQLRKEIKDRSERRHDLTLLAVSVFGGSYAQDSETRRRTRFAAISALGLHGYRPDSPEAIGYFRPEPDDRHLTVPYEWFGRRPPAHADVLLLWVNEEKLKSLEKLQKLFDDLTPPEVRDKVSWRMVGPAGSSTLIRLVRGNLAPVGTRSPPDPKLQIFAPSPTIPSCELYALADSPQPCPDPEDRAIVWLLGKSSPSPVAVVRATGTDDVLAEALLWELAQRGVNRQAIDQMCADGLVLITEWDTDYARGLLRYLVSARCQPKATADSDQGAHPFDRGATPKNVRTFTYLRGLDGALPDLDKSGDGVSTKDDRDKTKDLRAQLDNAPIEHAEGRSQFDYLRRLGDEIARLDGDRGFARNGVRAIGIVGSDVYDKLLILQALRSRFRDKIFFTTDLDARYLHADQKDWARNLVVASNFGLSLRPALQQNTLPFRDSYQTAAYLATLMALSDKPVGTWREKMRQWLRPHLFEIGRTEAVHLASPSAEGLRVWIEKGESPEDIDRPADDARCSTDLAPCVNIDPGWPSRRPSPRTLAMLLGMSVLALGLIALASRRVQAMIQAALHPPDPQAQTLVRATAIGVAAVVLVVASVVVIVGRALYTSLNEGVGEPFVWLEGVSVWPSLVLRFAGLVTTIALAAGFWISMRRQTYLIAKRFELGVPQWWPLSRRWWSAAWTGPHLDLASFDSGRSPRPQPDPDAPAAAEIDTLWQNYLRVTAPRAMWPWIALSTLLVLAFGVLAFQLLGRPAFPHRGRLVETLHRALVISTTGVLWLVVFWVGYETRAGARFIATLSKVRSKVRRVWPKRLLEREEGTTGVPRASLADYLDFQLIVAATRRIHGLIYLPFVSIVFPVVARSDLFDAMDFPPALVLVTGLALAYALYTAVLLRRSAEAARAKALEHYDEWLLAAARPEGAASPTPRVSPEQIRFLMERIRGTREGAFAPFAQQPAVQAVLLPFGSYGGVQLVEYLMNLHM
jgi:hypothetical protein